MKEISTKDFSSNRLTNGVRIQAEAFFLNMEKNGFEDVYTFSYKITFTNEGDQAVQLISRHWIIINSNGARDEVKGSGVVGEHPIIEPGHSYTYGSYSQITTPWGTMEGNYFFKKNDGQTFAAEIGRFYLIKDE